MTLFLGLLKNQKVWIGVGILVVILFAWMSILDYGNKRYDAGVASERAVWQQAMQVAQDRARNAENALAQDRANHERESAQRATQRTIIVQEARTQIHEAPDLESRLAALSALRERLRNTNAEDLARARANYLSSIAPDA